MKFENEQRIVIESGSDGRIGKMRKIQGWRGGSSTRRLHHDQRRGATRALCSPSSESC